MVTNRNIGRVIEKVSRLVEGFEMPVMNHFRHDPFLTLVGCLLSLRTKDETTLPACERLFALANTPEAMLRLSVPKIEKAIYPVGFYRTKAQTIQDLSHTLVSKYQGQVPNELDELLTIRGVGRKTANLVVTLAFQQDGICVDTHVHRISNRWGYIETNTADESEAALREKLPRHFWQGYNDLLVAFGRNLCLPVSPWCSRCPVEKTCAKVMIRHSR